MVRALERLSETRNECSVYVGNSDFNRLNDPDVLTLEDEGGLYYKETDCEGVNCTELGQQESAVFRVTAIHLNQSNSCLNNLHN
jgi:hypothetical protein